MTTAVVIGSGPNGLAAAVRLAEAGVAVTVFEAAHRIGGGTRSSYNTVPGLLHDDCSAFHPMGIGSPYFKQLDLQRHGLTWLEAPIQLAHPLDDGSAGLLHRSVARTAQELGGTDGESWMRTFSPLAREFDAIAHDVLRPVLRSRPRMLPMLAFGSTAALSAKMMAGTWRGQPARALFAGSAAHLMAPLTRPFSASVGVLLTASAHAYGWPVAQGGSQAISAALAARLAELGGTIVTDFRVESIEQLPTADIVMADLSPTGALDLLGDRAPARTRRAYTRYRYGPGAFKLDLAVEGGIPWTNPAVAQAGMVHLGGTLEEVVATEASVSAGIMPQRPFVLVGQQYVADPSRSVGDVHPVWAYAHVPSGWSGDATEAIIGQIERFAPGVRGRIVGRFTRSTAGLQAYNANYVGGDISTGSNAGHQLIVRPRGLANPYRTGVRGIYLCSAATPPGAGVHGMCGFNAAERALADLG